MPSAVPLSIQTLRRERRFSRFYRRNDYPEIRRRLLSQAPLRVIMRELHHDGFIADGSVGTAVYQSLRRLQRVVRSGLQEAQDCRRELRALQRLYLRLEVRIEEGMALERERGKLKRSVRRDLVLARHIVEASALVRATLSKH